MSLTMRPTGLGSRIDKDRPTTPSIAASGRSVASTKSMQSVLVLADEPQRPDEGLGEAGRDRLGLRRQGAVKCFPCGGILSRTARLNGTS